jgi:hypothetical protein
LADRGSWTYWNGAEFVAAEASAKPVIESTCVGELSARRHPTLDLILVAYNCLEPRGVLLHAASEYAGPFSGPQLLVDVDVSKGVGYGHAFHSSTSAVGYDDGLSEAGREEEWGGEYGPYIVPAWSGGGGGEAHDLVFTLSSWNPYQVHLMRAKLGPEGATYTREPKGRGLPKATLANGDFRKGDTSGWTAAGDAFVVFRGPDGEARLTTYVEPKGDRVKGKLWQEFTVDSTTSELRFQIHGGHARVVLLDGNDVVRESRGRNANEPELTVRWHLESLRGRKLRLQIEDDSAEPWGFVGVRGFELR